MIKSKLIEFKDESYTVNFPNVGQLQDIEAFKMSYTNGRYIDMFNSGLKIHEQLLDMTDAIAYLAILCPKLMENLKIKSWRNCDPFLAKEIVNCYKTQFIPWYKPLLEDLYKFDEVEETPVQDGKENQ